MAEVKTGDNSKGDHTPGTLKTSLPAATEDQRHLAQQAVDEFERGNYEDCLTALNDISSTRSRDPKVAHNKAVADFHKKGLTGVEEFRNTLVEICAKASISLDSLTGLDDVDQSVIYYNHAVVCYHLRQYQTAANIVNRLFQFIEPMDDVLGRKFTFLLVDLYLCTYQPEKALNMIAFIEKSLFGNGKPQQSPDKEKDGTGKETKDHNYDSTINETWRPKISQYKARCYVMLKSLKPCKREVKCLMNSVGTNIPVVYLKSNFEFLRCNYRKAIKVLNSAPPPASSIAGLTECMPVMYYNNMAVIHFHLRKHNLGAFYLRKAIQENIHASKTDNKGRSSLSIHTLSVSHHNELLYNMGIQQLHCGQPQAAFDCLIETVQTYQSNPRLWLRLAECCIMLHKKNNDEDRILENRLSVIQGSVGSGVHRKLMLAAGLNKDNSSCGSAALPVSSLEFASLCLKNALSLLPEEKPASSTSLPPNDEQTDEQTDGQPVAETLSAPPANPMKSTELANLRCSVLVASTYVCLCLSDQLMALHFAEQLFKQPTLSGAHRYLGHLYIGEALVALDRIADAIQYLNPDDVTDISTTPPEQKQQESEKFTDKDSQEICEVKVGALYPWSPQEIPRAKAIVKYNLATAHAIRGEYEKALMHLGQSIESIGSPLPAQMHFLEIYLELMEGRRKSAQTVIKKHFGHVTFNRT